MRGLWNKVATLAFVAIVFLGFIPYLILKKAGIIPLLIYFQLAILVAQLELMVKSQELYSLQYYPQIYLMTIDKGNTIHLIGKSKNVPAYNPRIIEVLADGKPIDRSKWKVYMTGKPPTCITDSDTEIAVIQKRIFQVLGEKLTFEMIYDTPQNVSATMSIVIFYDHTKGLYTAYVLPPRYRRRTFPAVFYVLETISEVYEAIWLRRLLRKFERNKISQDHSK
ncbi:MAG: hypothetical protein J7L51_04545 [Desulfurococcales archaeon]|nr:hypothetical protein [Desulfurococcales archaeon]